MRLIQGIGACGLGVIIAATWVAFSPAAPMTIGLSNSELERIRGGADDCWMIAGMECDVGTVYSCVGSDGCVNSADGDWRSTSELQDLGALTTTAVPDDPVISPSYGKTHNRQTSSALCAMDCPCYICIGFPGGITCVPQPNFGSEGCETLNYAENWETYGDDCEGDGGTRLSLKHRQGLPRPVATALAFNSCE